MHLYEVIKHPMITEKSRYQAERAEPPVHLRGGPAGQQVAGEGGGGDDLRGRVVAVNIMNLPAKSAKRWGRRRVMRLPMWKKAVVTLVEGQIRSRCSKEARHGHQGLQADIPGPAGDDRG
jgi:ribosomal protein L23